MPRGPLSERYPADVGLVVCSLIPYLALTAAVYPLVRPISHSTGLSVQTVEVTIAVSTAGYAMGTVLAVQLAMHLPPRRLLVTYEVLLFLSSLLAAWSPTGAVFIGAFIVQGLCTSLLLIAAVPPLVTQWPPSKMPFTGGIMNLCIFGAVAAGPTIGAIQAGSGSWRPLFWGVAAVAGIALILSLLTFEDQPAVNRDAPWDFAAIAMTVVGSGAAFFGAGRLEATDTAGLLSLAPLVGGAVLLLLLVTNQYFKARPLMPVRAVATTVPVAGIFVALMASAASFTIMELLLQFLGKAASHLDTGLYFLPEFVAAIVIAVVFGMLFSTRWVPVLAIGGLPAIAISAGIAIGVLPATAPALGAVTGVLGLGVGASVSPGLFMAGFSLRSVQLQPVFAMIELLRAVTAFLIAPIIVYLTTLLGSGAGGLKDGLWICVGIAGLGFIGGWALYSSGKRGLENPNLKSWQGDGEPAWASPPLLDRLGRR